MTFALPKPNASKFAKIKFLEYRPAALLALSIGLLLAVAQASAPLEAPTLDDGTYLFGENSEVDQPGTTYMVAKVSDGRIIGGFYQPHSSFDCFYGTIAHDEMALTVINSYEQTEHTLAMALESRTAIASQREAVSQWVPIGFHSFAELSAPAENVLKTCRTDL